MKKPPRDAEEALDEFQALTRRLTLAMLQGKEPPITGNDRVGGTVHAGVHALAYFHAAHAVAHMEAAYLERFVLSPEEETE